MVDKTVLIEYADVQEEIKDLRKRIEKGERDLEKLNKTIVADTVSCGKKGKKPIQTIKVTGIPDKRIEQKRNAIEKYRKMMDMKEIELLEKQSEAEDYIESIRKSEIRQIFRLYFIDGMSLEKVAREMNKRFPKKKIRYSDENIKKKIQRFFENVPQCPEKV